MTSKRKIRICLVEDHRIVRHGVKLLLASQPDIEVSGEAQDRKSALEVVVHRRPDVVLLDIKLGKESGLDFVHDLMAVSDARVILFTCSSEPDEIHRAVDAGVSGVVFKDEDPDVLIQAVHKVYAGEYWLPRSVMTEALERLRSGPVGAKAPNPEQARIASLTPRELEIASLAAGGVNRRGIAEKLFLSEGTVRNHLTSIFGKLEVSNQIGLVFYARRHGLERTSHR